jgi:hypothetical protein
MVLVVQAHAAPSSSFAGRPHPRSALHALALALAAACGTSVADPPTQPGGNRTLPARPSPDVAPDAGGSRQDARVGVFLVDENFNAATTGGEPAGWTIEGAAGAVAVAEVPFAANKSLAVARAGATGAASASIAFEPTSGRVVVEAKVKAMTASGTADLPVIFGADGVTPVVRVAFDGGQIASSAGASTNAMQSFQAGVWYLVRVVLDTTAQSYDLWIDGTRVLARAPLASRTTSVAGVGFDVAQGAAGLSYVDDVRVYELGAFVGPPPAPVFDAKSFGARGDGTTKDTSALQAAIDAIPASGGTLYVHDGMFITGTLRLKSHLTFYVDPSATLEASPDRSDFPAQSPPTQNLNLSTCRRAVLYAEGATDVTIDGGGTIDGNGSLPQYAVHLAGAERNRPILFWAVQTSSLAIRNVTFHDGAVWGIVPMESSHVVVDNVYVDSTAGTNRDGIDVVDSSDVTIEHSVFHTDDDAICPKSGVAAGVHDLVVHDAAVTLSTIANGLKFGTVSYGAFTDATFSDVLVKNVAKGGISVEAADGAGIAGLSFQRIEIDRAGTPLFVLVENRGETPRGSPAKVGSIDGVQFVDIRATNTSSTEGSPVVGLVQDGVRYPLQNLAFANVDLEYPGGATTVPGAPAEPTNTYPEFSMFGPLPAAGLYFRHVDGLSFEGCQTTITTTDARPASAFVDVTARTGTP